MKNYLSEIIGLVVTVLIWSSNFVFGDILLRYYSPFFLSFVRFAVATIGVFVIVLFKKEFAWFRVKDIPKLAVLGLCGTAFYNAIIYFALEFSSPANSSLIKAFNPTLTLLLSVFLFKQRLNRKQIFSCIVCLIGVILIVTNGDISSINKMDVGDLLVFGSCFLWSMYTILSSKFKLSYTPLQLTLWVEFFGTLIIMPYGIFEQLAYSNYPIPFNTFLTIFYLGFVASTLGMIIWQKGVRELGIIIPSIVYNLIPFFTLILSFVILKEGATFVEIFGGVIVCAGTILAIK